jgi:serine/threonine-protein kinase
VCPTVPSPNGANACQHVLGIRDNVVVGARRCTQPDGVSPGDSGQVDPGWAGNDGERLAAAMLEKVLV